MAMAQFLNTDKTDRTDFGENAPCGAIELILTIELSLVIDFSKDVRLEILNLFANASLSP